MQQPVNRVLSEEQAAEVIAKPRECFWNAVRVLIWSKAGSPWRNAAYVEGACWHIDSPPPFHHGWVELDGEIIDPTLTVFVARKIRMRDKELARQTREEVARRRAAGERLHYEPHRRFSYEEAMARAVYAREKLPFTTWAECNPWHPTAGLRVQFPPPPWLREGEHQLPPDYVAPEERP
jgi:hypothetical protein